MTPEHRKKLHTLIGKELTRSRRQAIHELDRMKKLVDETISHIERFVEKNPDQAALIAAGIGTAVGAAAALFLKKKKKRKKEKN